MWMFTTWHCVEHTVQCRENIWQVPSNYQHSSLNIHVVTVAAQRCSFVKKFLSNTCCSWGKYLHQSPSIVFQITTTLNFGFSRFSIALFVSYCIQAFRNVIRIENHGSGTVCSSKGETCYTTVIALHRTPCGSEFNHWQETMVMVLWFPWLQKGGGGSTA